MDKLKRFAWVFGTLGGVLVLAFLISYAVNQSVETTWGVVGGIGGALLALYLYLDRDAVGNVAKARNTSLVGGSFLLVALALGLAIALNVLGKRYDKSLDWTTNKVFTLSDQSVQVAQGLDQPIEILGFFTYMSVEQGESFEERVNAFSEHTDLLNLTMIDPEQEPLVAQQYGVTSTYGTVVLVMGDKQQRMESEFTEEALTNALINLTSGKDHVLCFTTGHGERDVDDDYGETGLGGVTVRLEGTNYVIQPYNPLKQGDVPAECEVVVVAGAMSDFLAPELEVLARYVAQGGALMVMFENFQSNGGLVTIASPALAADMERYGIRVGDDLVIEQDPQNMQAGLDPSIVLLLQENMDFHPIVTGLEAVILSLVRSVEAVDPAPAHLNVQILGRTSVDSWAESDPLGSGVEGPVPDGDERIGEIGVMAVAEVTDASKLELSAFAPNGLDALPTNPTEDAGDNAVGTPDATEEAPAPAAPSTSMFGPVDPVNGGRVVVIGDVDFASNQWVINGQNMDLYMNSLAWLVGEEDQIAIRANEAKAGQLSASLGQQILVGFLVLFIVPGLTVVGSIVTWIVRRKL